jgi:hypothetical protein
MSPSEFLSLSFSPEHPEVWESHKERDHYKHLDAGGKIILKQILKKVDGGYWIHLA